MAFNRERALASAAKFAGRGQHDRAAREYQSIVEADPSDIRSWVMLADCLVRAGDNPGAIDRFTKVAAFYAENDEPTKAVAVYRQILNLDASRLDIHVKIAELLHSLGRTPDAIATYEFVAQSYFQAGKVAEGLEGFRMVAELDVAAVAKRLRVAELYSREGRKDAAVEHFRLAAQRLLAKNRYDDYIRVGERLLYHKDDDADILRSLAELYLVHAKEPRRALMKLNGLLRVSPNDALGLELLADTFIALGKKDKAISVATELAKDLRKGDGEAKREAARILQKALAWGPESPAELQKALAEVEKEVGALGAGEPEVLIDVADDLEDELDLDVDIDEGGDDFEIDETEELGDDGYDVAMTAAQKLVVETQVYVRYKMFEHALAHIDELLEIEPSDLEAIEMRADVFDRMGRHQDAADLYVHLAQLVGEEDASRAERFLDQALALVPDHAKASMMLTTLEAVGRGSGRRPIISEMPAAKPVDTAQADRAADKRAAEDEKKKKLAEQAAAQKAAQARAIEAKRAEQEAEQKAEENVAEQEASAAKQAEKKAADARKPLFGGGTPLPSLLPTREGRTPLPGRPRGATPLPDILPRRDGTPAPGVVSKRDDDGANEAPVTTDDSGLLRFSAPKKRPPPPPPPPPGRGRRRSSSSDRRRVERSRPSGDSDSSEGESEPSQARQQGIAGPETQEVEEVEELDVMEFLDVDEVEEFEDDEVEGDAVEGAADDEADETEADSREASAPVDEPEADSGEEPEPEPALREDDAPAENERSGRAALGFLPTRGRPGRRARRRESAKLTAAESESVEAESAESDSEPQVEAEQAQEAAVVDEPAVDRAGGEPSDIIETVLRSDEGVQAEVDAGEELESEAADGSAQTAESSEAAQSDLHDADADDEVEAVEEVDASGEPVFDGSSEAAQTDALDGADEFAEGETVEAETTGADEAETIGADDTTGADETETVESETSEAEASDAEATAVEMLDAETADAETTVVEMLDAEADDAETDDAETDEASEAETTDDAETSDAETDDAETSDAETADAETTDAETADAETADVETIDAEAIDAETSDAETDDVETIDAETIDAETIDAETIDAETIDAETLDVEATDTDTLEGDSLGGLAEEVEAEDAAEAAEHPDITDELEELKFFIEQEFDDDAAVTYLELVGRYPGHPALEPFAERFAKLDESPEEAAAPVHLDDEEELLLEQSGASLEAPVFDFEENDEEDDFLSSIFDDEPTPAKSKPADPPRARAELDGNADSRTLFDLGTAYREMGLIDDALTQFRAASRDSEWKARSLVMMASLHLHRGALPEAIADLEEAVAFAITDDERSEARYELGVIYQVMGETEKAIAALEAVNPGYRDRDDRLATLASA